MGGTDTQFAGVYVDLDHDGVDEFVFLSGFADSAYAFRGGAWVGIGMVLLQPSACCRTDWQKLIDDLTRGDLSVKTPQWSDLVIGQQVYRLNAAQ